jgi:hypothetical protein
MIASAGDGAYFHRAACPCCGASAERSAKAVASHPSAEELRPEEHTNFVSGYSARRVFFSYHRCGECDALYCPVFYTEKQLGSLYGRQAENMADVPMHARVRTQHGYAELLMRHSRGDRGFLEIGADVGLFAERCAKLGRFEQFWLYEPNLSVHADLARRLAGHQYKIHSAMWPTSDLPRESCSSAALIHVLDHLLDPIEFLGKIRDALDDGGTVLVVTHNTGSLLARALGRRFPPFALQHPQLYSPASITRLFERAGYDIVRIADAVNYFPVMHLVRGGLSVLGLPSFAPHLQGPTVPIRLGNMAVIARKRA